MALLLLKSPPRKFKTACLEPAECGVYRRRQPVNRHRLIVNRHLHPVNRRRHSSNWHRHRVYHRRHPVNRHRLVINRHRQSHNRDLHCVNRRRQAVNRRQLGGYQYLTKIYGKNMAQSRSTCFVRRSGQGEGQRPVFIPAWASGPGCRANDSKRTERSPHRSRRSSECVDMACGGRAIGVWPR